MLRFPLPREGGIVACAQSLVIVYTQASGIEGELISAYSADFP